MLLEDATSKIQVQRALKDGDEELREDILEKLDDSMRWWDAHGFYRHVHADDDPVNFMDIADDDAFIDKVIKESPAEYDLSNVPRAEVESSARWAATHEQRGRLNKTYGPFRIGQEADYFSYRIDRDDYATFPEEHLPDNAEYIPVEQAKNFWASLDGHVTWEQTDRVEETSGYTKGEPLYVSATKEGFDEWCHDQVAEFVQAQIKAAPQVAIDVFMKGVEHENISLGAKLRAADLPEEELLDFAHRWFGSDDDREEILLTLKDHFATLETGHAEPREVIGEWTQADLREMGITKGPLYEEAPWKLIRLHPGDLRLEGTLMRHCVGDGGMGYTKALKDGEIEIWSLRSRANKPRFTLEVDGAFYVDEAEARRRAGDDLIMPAWRGVAIKQLKGKANRTPGHAYARATEIKFPDEVIFWDHALREFDVDPQAVDDFTAVHTGDEPARLQANSRDACTGFDLPYRPL
jgi:hypothetical protein